MMSDRKAALVRELDVLHHVDRWTPEDRARIAAIETELLKMENRAPLPVKPREPIPEEKTLAYSLESIRQRFGGA